MFYLVIRDFASLCFIVRSTLDTLDSFCSQQKHRTVSALPPLCELNAALAAASAAVSTTSSDVTNIKSGQLPSAAVAMLPIDQTALNANLDLSITSTEKSAFLPKANNLLPNVQVAKTYFTTQE